MTDHEELVIELRANLANLKEDIAEIKDMMSTRVIKVEERVDVVEANQDKLKGAAAIGVPIFSIFAVALFEVIKKVL